MKKTFLIIISILLLTACSNNLEVITCKASEEISEGYHTETITATFEKNVFTKYSILTTMEYNDLAKAKEEYEKMVELESTYEELGMEYQFSRDINVVTVSFEVDVLKMKENLSEEESQFINADSSNTTFIREMEESGYICK